MDSGQDGGERHHAGPGAFGRWLTHPRWPLMVTILAMVLTLPSLHVGRVADDLFHQIKLLGTSRLLDITGPSLDLFTFFDGDPERTFRLMDAGVLPWWTVPNLKASFWRPVTVLTHWLDYQLWPDLPILMHAHSILWFGAAVLIVALFYRRLMGPTWIAGLAALFFAIDDAHGMPVGFLANRNVLLATVFGVLSLSCHDRWRRDGWRHGALWGPVFFALSLLSKEAGVAIAAYLFAYAMFLDRTPWRRSFAALWSYGVVLVLWRLAWTSQGYGLWGMGPYVDPGAEPMRYFAAVIQRAPILLLGQWALPPSDAAVLLDAHAARYLWFGALAFVVVLIVILIPLLQRDRLARFWATGMVLSVFPPCATFPSDRSLFFVGLGGMGLLAAFLALVFERRGPQTVRLPRRVPAMALAIGFLFAHAVVAPILLSLRASAPLGPKRLLGQLLVSTPMDRSVEHQDVVIVNAPVVLHALYLPLIRELNGEPVPRRTRSLAPGYAGVTLHRPDEQTLVIRPRRGFLDWDGDQLVRGEHLPMSLGQRVKLTGVIVEVTALTPDNRPAEATFSFDVPLEDPSLRWLFWEDGSFIPFSPPAVGETVELPPALPTL